MATNNPAFKNPAFSQQGAQAYAVHTASATELQDMYNRPEAGVQQADRMTVEDTVMKSAIAFGVLVVGAAAGWYLGAVMPALVFGAAIIGFVLALVNIFKKEPSAPLILAYAAAQGVFVGGISYIFEQFAAGIVIQAVLATLTVVGVTLALFASGKIRASKKATKIFLIAMVGYLVFSLINVGLQMFGRDRQRRSACGGIEFWPVSRSALSSASSPSFSARTRSSWTSTSSSVECRTRRLASSAGPARSASWSRSSGCTSRSCACSRSFATKHSDVSPRRPA